MTTVWKTVGDAGRDIFLMQKLHPLIETITDTVVGVKVDKVTVLGTGGGNGAGDLASQVIAGNEKMKAALGVDVVGALQSRLAQPAEVVTPTEVSAPVIEAQPEVAKAIPAPKARPANTAQRRMAAPPPAATPARPVG